MDSRELIERTKTFALRIIAMTDALPTNRSTEIISKQIIRSATSVSANYRAASRAQSPAEFVSKMHIVHEEADETQHWLELLLGTKAISKTEFDELWKEASELTAIFTASYATARRNKLNKRSKNS